MLSIRISIITINYNNVQGLEQTIKSVVDQTYPNIEYIVIDGGSTDGSKDVVEGYKNQISYWVSEPDSGIYNAMNKGIRIATGEYLLFINSGDFLMNPQIIEEVVAAGLNYDLVYGNLFCINRPGGEEWYPAVPLTFEVFYKSTIPHPATFIKRELFEQVGLYNEENAVVSDWEFFLLATCKYNCSCQYINKFIAKFMDGGISSEPSNVATILQEREQVLKTHFAFFIRDYDKYDHWAYEMKKINYFIKARIFIKNIFRSKKRKLLPFQ